MYKSIKNLRFLNIALAIVLLISFGCKPDLEVKKVSLLTIGNSFADNACKYLSEITSSVPGCKISITKANIGGCPLDKHAALITACSKDSTLKPYYQKYSLKDIVSRDTFDVVTIQQLSSKSYRYETYQPYADSIYNFVREQAPLATVMVHQTWAYSPLCKRLNEFGISRSKMHDDLTEAYQKLADSYGAELLPSGDAMYRSFANDSTIYLWKESENDNFHANAAGEYLVGCVWFGTLFDVSPIEVKFVPEELNATTAEYLRGIADATVRAYQEN